MTEEHRNEEPGQDSQYQGGQAGRRPGRGRHFRSHKQSDLSRSPEGGQGTQSVQGSQGGSRSGPERNPAAAYSCAICGKPIYDLTGALSDKDSGLPVHFDCALEKVAAEETLSPGEKIAYLGSGCFGVVAATGDKSDGAFTVLRRIRWEKEGEKKDWRKILSSGITKI